MLFESKAKKEERLRLEEMQRQAYFEQQRKAVAEYVAMYKSDSDILRLASQFYEDGLNGPKHWTNWKLLNQYKGYVNSNENRQVNIAYIYWDNQKISFIEADQYASENDYLYSKSGFAQIEDSAKQKAVAIVVLDYLKNKIAEECYAAGFSSVSGYYNFCQIYYYWLGTLADHPCVGVVDDDFKKKMVYSQSLEKHPNYGQRKKPFDGPVPPRDTKIFDGAILIITNNQVNRLREL